MTDLIVHVSDHAVERYIERVGDELSPEHVRIGVAELVRPAAEMKARRFAYHGVTLCISYRGNIATVTTVYEGALPRPHRARHRRFHAAQRAYA